MAERNGKIKTNVKGAVFHIEAVVDDSLMSDVIVVRDFINVEQHYTHHFVFKAVESQLIWMVESQWWSK